MGRSLRDWDWLMVILSLALSGIGILQIYSATLDTKLRDAWWKQIVFVAVGIVALWVVSNIDYHSILGQVPLLYFGSLGLLVLTFAVGKTVFGSRRWISLGGFNFQASEFVKLVVILLVARYLSELRTEKLEARDLLRLVVLVGLPLVLVLLQPDLGTSLTYVPVLAIGVFLAGLRWKHAVAILILTAVALPAAWFVLHDYQRGRVLTFLNPARDPKGAGYQVIQSRIAVGAGGMWGEGVTRGSQTQLRFLPVSPSDFIFSAYAEEHGFVGVIFALGLYFLLLMQIIQNAQTAPDRAGTYICMGVATLLLFHLLVNVGMVVGRMPVTGIPLPLMSSGGSNTLSMFLMLGLVNNVRLRRFVN